MSIESNESGNQKEEKEICKFKIKNFKILSKKGSSAKVKYDFYVNGKLYYKGFESVWTISEQILKQVAQS